MHSAIYTGRVRHRRFDPVDHAFNYRLFMLYLDLAELPTLFDRCALWSNEGWAPARFRRRDHLKHHAPPATPLDAAVRDLVAQQTAARPAGPIRLLTHLEYFRYRFNPVSFYFCYDAADTHVESIVAEINNTPWGEQHCYVLGAADNRGHQRQQRFEFDKAFHISPFMGMDTRYTWHLTEPGPTLGIHMRNDRQGRTYFDATLALRRQALTPAALNTQLLRFPLMTVQVIAAIHWQALKLWWKGCPYHPHPKTRTTTQSGAETC